MRRTLPIAPMASCFALTGFAIAIVSGIFSGSPSSLVIEQALVATVLCYIIAVLVGKGCALIVREHMARYTEANPIPTFADSVRSASREEAERQSTRSGDEESQMAEAA